MTYSLPYLLMPSDKCNLIMHGYSYKGLISSLFNIDLSIDVPFRQPQQLQCMLHTVCHSLSQFGDNESLALLKLDMKNAFNECSHSEFLEVVCEEFPEISSWVYWCYSQSVELQFGHRCIRASTGVQQGDPLGPYFFLWCC